MAAPGNAVTFEGIKAQLSKRQYAPIYLLHGEEGYFIDALVKEFEEILPPEERDFNMYTMYAPQVSADDVMDACRRYPMMSEYQVVILKEAQSVRADYVNRLHLYASQPSPTTILVICCVCFFVDSYCSSVITPRAIRPSFVTSGSPFASFLNVISTYASSGAPLSI